MTASSILPAPNLMPLMRYRDLAGAMSWLEQAFGFEKQVAVADSDGAIIYGQMTYRGSVLMMGAVRDTDLDKLMRQPDEVGGVETQSCYLVVDDADAHYSRAQDAGAEVVLDIKSDGLGRRGYSCRDPEGHIWNFGTYNPAKGLTMLSTPSATAASPPVPRQDSRMRVSFVGLLVLLGAMSWWFTGSARSDLPVRMAIAAERHSASEAERAYDELVKVRAEKRRADELAQTLKDELASERARRVAIEPQANKAAENLAQEQTARRTAEATVASLREELKRQQVALDAAVEARRVSEEKLAVRLEPPSAPMSPVASSVATSATSASEIETSATRPPSEAASRIAALMSDDKDDEPISRPPSANRHRASVRHAQRSRRTVVYGSTRRYLPTYVIDMHEVPWPYSTWYK